MVITGSIFKTLKFVKGAFKWGYLLTPFVLFDVVIAVIAGGFVLGVQLVFPFIPGGGLYYTMSAIVQVIMQEAFAQGVLTLKYALGIAVGISLSGTYRKIYKKF